MLPDAGARTTSADPREVENERLAAVGDDGSALSWSVRGKVSLSYR